MQSKNETILGIILEVMIDRYRSMHGNQRLKVKMKIEFTFSSLGSNSNDCVRKLMQTRETIKGNTEQIYLDTLT